MDVSIFLAKAIGLVFVIFGVSLLIAKPNYQTGLRELINSPAMLFLGGTINLIIGILVILSHNIWQLDWRVLVTIVGWLLVIRGIIWTTFPKVIQTVLTLFIENSSVYFVGTFITLILGIVLCYFGFR